MFFFARFSSFYKSLFVLFNIILVILTLTKNANGDEQVIIAHGISTFGDLKYKNNFKHLDYVNPSAPKGGEVSIWAFGSFDSMHPYTTKGRSGSLSSIFFESLLTGTSDEIDSAYGLVAESLEYPKDRSWVIFNMRSEARFSSSSEILDKPKSIAYILSVTKKLLVVGSPCTTLCECREDSNLAVPKRFFSKTLLLKACSRVMPSMNSIIMLLSARFMA